jgi:hypothetical protein
MLKRVLSMETVKDGGKESTYVVTKYMDESMSIKIYKKNPITQMEEYLKTIQVAAKRVSVVNHH